MNKLNIFQVTSSWGIGLVMGPALGGYLAEVFSYCLILISLL